MFDLPAVLASLVRKVGPSLILVQYRAVTAVAASVGCLQEHSLLPHRVCCGWVQALVWNLSHWAMFAVLSHFQVRSNLWVPDLKVIFFPDRFFLPTRVPTVWSQPS